ncbi:MAG: PhoH family protein, partial [Verrucomicrobiota bacterium]
VMTDLQSDSGAGGPSHPSLQSDLFKEAHSGSKRRKRSTYGNGLKAPSKVGKNFVLDTNVLLHDPDCLDHFADNHICIPIEVLCELDRFKNEQTERGANARAAHRKLAALFSSHPNTATKGIPTEGGGSVRLVPGHLSHTKRYAAVEELAEILRDTHSNDHRILLCTRAVAAANPSPAVLVTKDLNLQLKAHALGLACDDYQNDKVDLARVNDGQPIVLAVKPNELQRFASSGSLVAELPDGVFPNDYVLLQSGSKQTMPARVSAKGELVRLRVPDQIRIQRGTPLRPLNLAQHCFLDSLLDPSISLVTCYGQAGTGKTLLAVASALQATFGGHYNGVTVSRPVIPMGDTLGFLPGSLEEKLDPWLKPIYDALEFILTPDQPPSKKRAGKARKQGPEAAAPVGKIYDPLLESGLVEIEALCYIRGRSIPNRYFILDEAQQLTPLEAKTIVTRMAKGSKLVLIGDPAQIDNPYVDRLSNGLVYTRDKLRQESFSAHVALERGERSELAEAAAKKM